MPISGSSWLDNILSVRGSSDKGGRAESWKHLVLIAEACLGGYLQEVLSTKGTPRRRKGEMRGGNSIKSVNQGTQFHESFRNYEPKDKNFFYIYHVLIL